MLRRDVAGAVESPVYAILDVANKLNTIKLPEGYTLSESYTEQPFLEDDFALKWDGEWHITYEVFRDLGAAFAVVLVVIYILIIGWFQGFQSAFCNDDCHSTFHGGYFGWTLAFGGVLYCHLHDWNDCPCWN